VGRIPYPAELAAAGVSSCSWETMIASMDWASHPVADIFQENGPLAPVSNNSVWPLCSSKAAKPQSDFSRESVAVLSYRMVSLSSPAAVAGKWGLSPVRFPLRGVDRWAFRFEFVVSQ